MRSTIARLKVMRQTKFFPVALIAVSIFIFPERSYPQYTDSLGVPFSNPISASMSTMIWGHINRAAIQGAQRAQSGRGTTSTTSRRSSGSASSRNVPSASSVRTASPPNTTEIIPAYRRYPAVQFKSTGTRLVLDEYLSKLEVTDSEKADLRLLIPAIWDVYEEEAVLKGYPNDVALAIVSFIGLNGYVHAGRTTKLSVSFEQNVGLRDMLAEKITDAGSLDNSTDRQKQEVYELLTMLGGLTLHLYREALKKNDLEEIREVRLLAANNLKLLGIEP